MDIRRLLIAIATIIMLFVLVSIGWIFYYIVTDPTPFWYLYWLIIISGITTMILLRNQVDWIGSVLAYYCAKLSVDNNWWWGTSVVIGIIFTFNFMIAGPGAPIILKAGHDITRPIVEWAHTEEGTRQIDTWLHGSDYTESADYQPKVKPLKSEQRKYSSWIHFKIMYKLWIFVIIFYFVTHSDDFRHALREGVRRGREKHYERFNDSGGEEGEHDISHSLGDWAKIAIPFEIMVEVFEIFFTRLFFKFKPYAQEVMSKIKVKSEV